MIMLTSMLKRVRDIRDQPNMYYKSSLGTKSVNTSKWYEAPRMHASFKISSKLSFLVSNGITDPRYIKVNKLVKINV